MLVPERCAPAMQIAVWISAPLFTQRLYTTTLLWVRQADCFAGSSRKMFVARSMLHIYFYLHAAK
jgi:hypothetical protein